MTRNQWTLTAILAVQILLVLLIQGPMAGDTAPAEAQALFPPLESFTPAKLEIQGPGEELEIRRAWNRKLAEARYVAVSWPREFGGREASVIEQVVWAEEMHRAGAPPALNPIGLDFLHSAFLSGEQLSRNIAQPIVFSGLAILVLIGIIEWLVRFVVFRRRARGAS